MGRKVSVISLSRFRVTQYDPFLFAVTREKLVPFVLVIAGHERTVRLYSGGSRSYFGAW